MHVTPRSLTLAASIAWRHVTGDPVRAALLAWRVLPSWLRPLVRMVGPYGAAAALRGAGERAAAINALAARPRRLAAFALAVDQPAMAREALSRADGDDPAWPHGSPGGRGASPTPSEPSTAPVG